MERESFQPGIEKISNNITTLIDRNDIQSVPFRVVPTSHFGCLVPLTKESDWLK